MATRLDELLDIASAISRGEIPRYQSNECFTAGAFDLLVVKVQGAEAFELLQALCDRFDAVDAPGITVAGYYDLIAHLARLSNTTEMPRGLEAILARHPELAREIGARYRRSG